MPRRRKTIKEIANITENILKDFYNNSKVAFPINIEGIMEEYFHLRPILQKDLEKSGVGEAFITIGAEQIIIDEDLYLRESRRSRLLFSLAHEIAHYVLHKDLISGITTLKEYTEKIQNIDEESFNNIEKDADIFAGFLLLPTQLLNQEISSQKKPLSKWNLNDTANFVKYLSQKTNCHPTTVSIQLQRVIGRKYLNISIYLKSIIEIYKTY